MAPAARRGRSSGLASPPDPKTDEVQPHNSAADLPSKPNSAAWVEPHLRPPVPSYKDHYVKDYEGNISTVHMKALGHMPTQKDVDKRYVLKGVKGSRKNEAGTRHTTPVVAPAPAPAPRASTPPATNGKDVDSDFTPTTRASGKPTLTPAEPGQLPLKVFDPEDPKGPLRLKGVVEHVVQRAKERNTPDLGKAVKKLWLASFAEPAIADLIDAVLSQKPTPEQAADFQRRVKIARSQINEVNGSPKHSSSGKGSDSKSSLKSPSKRDRGSHKRRLETAEEVSDAPGSNINGDSNNATMQHHNNDSMANGTPSKRPTKRTKRSTSISSSTSSLSSLASSDQGLPPPNERHSSALIPPPPSLLSSSDKQQAGPKLHSFPLSNPSKSSSKRSLDSPAPSADDEAAAKRRKLRQTFDVTVNDSEIRKPLTTDHQPSGRLTVTKPPLSLRSQHPRARSAASHQRLDDDLDVESSLSPVNGDLLAPPFANERILARGSTPTRLGRPPKNVNKGARVKMS